MIRKLKEGKITRSGRPGGQLVARVSPGGLAPTISRRRYSRPTASSKRKERSLWRNISEPSSSADSTTTAQFSSGPQGRGVTDDTARQRLVMATSLDVRQHGELHLRRHSQRGREQAPMGQDQGRDKTLLICDRVILVSVSWDDLNGQGYVTGKTITIDGAKYKCRLLTGGSNRNGITTRMPEEHPPITSGTGSSPARKSSGPLPRFPLTWTPTSTRPITTVPIISFGIGWACIPGVKRPGRRMLRIARSVGTIRPATGISNTAPATRTRTSVSAPSLKS